MKTLLGNVTVYHDTEDRGWFIHYWNNYTAAVFGNWISKHSKLGSKIVQIIGNRIIDRAEREHLVVDADFDELIKDFQKYC